MHNTGTSSSWINQVERWFGFITDELIRRGSHTCVQALEADIRARAKGWNEDPKPFIWTKPAEQILESIGRLLTPVSYTHLRAHETRHDLVCRLLLEKKKKK